MKKLTKFLTLTLCIAFLLSSFPDYEEPVIDTYDLIEDNHTQPR